MPFRFVLRASRPSFTTPLAPPRLCCRGDLALPGLRQGLGLFERHRIAGYRIESEHFQAFRKMGGEIRRDIDRAAVGCIDADPTRVEVQLAADAAGQER